MSNKLKGLKRISKQIDIKGLSERNKAIRAGGGVMPTIGGGDIPQTKKANIEELVIKNFNSQIEADSNFSSICKTAFLGINPANLKNYSHMAALGGAAILAQNQLNQGGNILDAGLAAGAALPFIRMGTNSAERAFKNIKATNKATEHLSTDFAKNAIPDELKAKGINRFSGVRDRYTGAINTENMFKEHEALKNKVNRTAEEEALLKGHEYNINKASFKSQYNQGGILNRFKGKAIELGSLISPELKQNMESGRYTSPEMSGAIRLGNQQNIQQLSNMNQNLEYMKKHNINPHDVVRDIYRKGEDPDTVFNLSHDEFKQHKAVPAYKNSFKGKIHSFFGGNPSVESRVKIDKQPEQHQSLTRYKNQNHGYDY